MSDTGSTPVRSACFMTHLEIVQFLVESGANILRANYNGGTCLINSVQSVPLCEYLLQHGAAVNALDIQQKTALHYAIQEHRLETTKLLLQYLADPYLKSRYGDDALQTSCLKGIYNDIFCSFVGFFNCDNLISCNKKKSRSNPDIRIPHYQCPLQFGANRRRLRTDGFDMP